MGLFDRPDYLGASQPVQASLYGATSPRDKGKYFYGTINKDLYNRAALGYVTGDIHVPLPGPAPAPYGAFIDRDKQSGLTAFQEKIAGKKKELRDKDKPEGGLLAKVVGVGFLTLLGVLSYNAFNR